MASNKERNNKMKNINKVSNKIMSKNEIDRLFAAVREQIARVPFLNKPKCYKAFVLNIILNSGLGYDEVMSYLDSLNAYDENDKGWKKIDWNMSIEEKFDILGWEKVVKKLIVWASTDSYSLAA